MLHTPGCVTTHKYDTTYPPKVTPLGPPRNHQNNGFWGVPLKPEIKYTEICDFNAKYHHFSDPYFGGFASSDQTRKVPPRDHPHLGVYFDTPYCDILHTLISHVASHVDDMTHPDV